jgi:CBS domain-containing protein
VITVEELGTLHPIMVDATETVESAASKMRMHHIHHLPVVAKDGVVGMLSARDLIGRVPEVSKRVDKPVRPERPLDAGHHLTVDDVCSEHVRSLPCDATIHRAAWMMVHHKIRSLPLVRDEHVVGILTDTDLLRACLSGIPRIKGNDPTVQWRHFPVADFMSSPVRTVEPTASVLHAWMLMREHDIRHLAVTRGDNFVVGIVSDDDAFYALRGRRTGDESSPVPECPRRISLSQIMTPNVVTIGKYDRLAQAAEKMLTHDISALLVMDFCLEGIITRVDLLKAIVKMG